MSAYIIRWCGIHGDWDDDVDHPAEWCPTCIEQGRYKTRDQLERELAAYQAEMPEAPVEYTLHTRTVDPVQVVPKTDYDALAKHCARLTVFLADARKQIATEYVRGREHEQNARVEVENAHIKSLQEQLTHCARQAVELEAARNESHDAHLSCVAAEEERELLRKNSEAARKDAERHIFAMRHVSYYSMQKRFLIDCEHECMPGSDASMDYENSIDAAIAKGE